MSKSVTLGRIRGLLTLTAEYIQEDDLNLAMAAQSLIAELMLEEGITGEDVQTLLVVNDEEGNPVEVENEETDLRSRVAAMIDEIQSAEEARVRVTQ